MSDHRTVHDPFHGKDVQISNRLVDRLRGKYAVGPHLPNGNPEFGWRQFQAPPIQHEAAERIEALEFEVADRMMNQSRLVAALDTVMRSLVMQLEQAGYSDSVINGHGAIVHARAAINGAEAWMPINDDTPRDREILVYAPPREGLPHIICSCRWHDDAGYCVDEIRSPTLWQELPAPPAEGGQS